MTNDEQGKPSPLAVSQFNIETLNEFKTGNKKNLYLLIIYVSYFEFISDFDIRISDFFIAACRSLNTCSITSPPARP